MTTAMKVVETISDDNNVRRVEGPLERQASVLADIQQMHEDFQLAREEIAQLKADLHHSEDRVSLLIAEKDNMEERMTGQIEKSQAETILFRDKLVELSTAMTNIGLLTITAQEIMKAVSELLAKAKQ